MTPDLDLVYRMSIEMRPIKEMAEALGVSTARVHRLREKLFAKGALEQCHRQDTSARPMTAHEDRVRILREQGLGVPEIVAETGLTHIQVSRITYKLRRSGELPPRNPLTRSMLARQGIDPGFPRHAVIRTGSVEFARWLADQNVRGDTLADTLVNIAFAQWQKEKPRP